MIVSLVTPEEEQASDEDVNEGIPTAALDEDDSDSDDDQCMGTVEEVVIIGLVTDEAPNNVQNEVAIKEAESRKEDLIRKERPPKTHKAKPELYGSIWGAVQLPPSQFTTMPNSVESPEGVGLASEMRPQTVSQPAEVAVPVANSYPKRVKPGRGTRIVEKQEAGTDDILGPKPQRKKSERKPRTAIKPSSDSAKMGESIPEGGQMPSGETTDSVGKRLPLHGPVRPQFATVTKGDVLKAQKVWRKPRLIPGASNLPSKRLSMTPKEEVDRIVSISDKSQDGKSGASQSRLVAETNLGSNRLASRPDSALNGQNAAIVTDEGLEVKRPQIAKRIPVPGRMFVSAAFNGIMAYSLVDTGSTRTMVTWSFYVERMGGPKYAPPLQQGGAEAKSISGHKIKGYGYATMPVRIGKFQHNNIRVYVTEDFGYDALIGSDVIAAFDMEMRPGSGILKIQGERIPTYKRQFKDPATGDIFPEVVGALDKSTKIPARTAKPLTCHVPENYPVGHYLYAAAGTSKQPPTHLRLYPGLHQVAANHTITIPVANESNKEVEVTEEDLLMELSYLGPKPKVKQLGQEGKPKSAAKPTEEEPLTGPAEGESIMEYISKQDWSGEGSAARKWFVERIMQKVDSGKPPKLIPGLNYDRGGYTKAQRLVWEYILEDLEECFAETDKALGCATGVKHQILTDEGPPTAQRARRQPMMFRAEIEKEVEKMLDAEVIEPSTSPWASPVVLVRKKCGNWRFCVDYRQLNKRTKPDKYPLPRTDEMIDGLRGCKYFCNMDLRAGYWQIPIAEEDREKTAFITEDGLYQWKGMPFGLTNAPATFQRLISHLCGPLPGIYGYIDDINFGAKTQAQLVWKLLGLCAAMYRAGLRFKASKCWICVTVLGFLGHIISEEGVSPDPEKVAAIREIPIPNNLTEVRAFLGITGYYRKFVPDYAFIACPLYDLTKKGRHGTDGSVEWTSDCQAAFQALKAILSSTEVLAYPDVTKPFELHTDASGFGVGAILHQADKNGDLRPVAYASRVLSGPEQNYGSTELELLAVIWALYHFRVYLLGAKVKILSDHSALRYVQDMKTKLVDYKGKFARWALFLQEFQLELCYREGKKHTNADGLSRLPLPIPINEPDMEEIFDAHELELRRDLWQIFTPIFRENDQTIEQMGVKTLGWVVPGEDLNVVDGRMQRMMRVASVDAITRYQNRRQKGHSISTDPNMDAQLTAQLTDPTQEVPPDLLEEEGLEVPSDSRIQADQPATRAAGRTVPASDGTKRNGSSGDERTSLFSVPTRRDKNRRKRNRPDRRLPTQEVEPVAENLPAVNPAIQTTPSYEDARRQVTTGEPEPARLGENLLTRFRKATAEDEWAQGMIRYLNGGKPPAGIYPLEAPHYQERMFEHDGLLWKADGARKKKHGGRRNETDPLPGLGQRLYVPEFFREKVLRELHGGRFGGHFCAAKTRATIMRRYFWPGLANDVQKYVDQCYDCMRFNDGRIPNASLNPITPVCPWYMVGVDAVTPSKVTTKNGMKHVLVFVDYFTKWVEAVPVPDLSAETFVMAFLCNIVCRHGCPNVLLSDKGTNFAAQLSEDLCRLLGTQKTFGMAYHPDTMGQVENMNKTLMRVLRHHTKRNQTDWDLKLPVAVAAYVSAVHESTGHTPYYMNHGRDMRLPVDCLMLPPKEWRNFAAYKKQLASSVQNIWEDVRRIVMSSKEVQKTQYDRNTFNRNIRVGDLVALKRETIPIGLSKKLHPQFNFPYIVTRVDWPNLVLKPVGSPNDVRTWAVHVNRVKKLEAPWVHPTFGSIPEPSIAREDPEDFFCKHCKKSWNEQQLRGKSAIWAECESCLEWMHNSCEGLPERENIEDHWYCKDCKKELQESHHELVAAVQKVLQLPKWIPGFGPFLC